MKIPTATYIDGGEQWTAVTTKTYRKLMSVVRAAETAMGWGPIERALDDLYRHLEKSK
jgi:hypothetical protein